MSKAAEKAYAEIKARILSGDFPAATHLKEEDLSKAIGVSRTPVREALRNLASEYFVKFVPNHGAYVASWSSTDVEEVFEFRKLLEGHAAGRAATRITDEDIDILDNCAREIERTIRDPHTHEPKEDLSAKERALFQELNSTYHKVFIAAAKSERLSVMVSWLSEAPIMLKTVTLYSPADFLRSNQYHIELVAALRARNAEWATSVIQAHLLSAKETFMAAQRPKNDARAKS